MKPFPKEHGDAVWFDEEDHTGGSVDGWVWWDAKIKQIIQLEGPTISWKLLGEQLEDIHDIWEEAGILPSIQMDYGSEFASCFRKEACEGICMFEQLIGSGDVKI